MPRRVGCGWARVTADQLVWRGPCVVYGAVILCSAAGGDATLYDSQGVDAPRAVITLKGPQNNSHPVAFSGFPQFDQGLYVDIGANCDEVVVFYDPILETEQG